MKNLSILCIFITVAFQSFAQNTDELKVGDTISEFSTLDENGDIWESAEVTSDFLVVYFYPAAMTGGCTKQACAYRDDKASFDALGVTVVGVSGDEVKNLKHFKNSYQLNFPLLSDNEGNISKIFGVPTGKGGSITREIEGENYELFRGVTTPRWTFVLDKNRKIIYKNAAVNAVEDAKKVKYVIENYLKG
jgi:peroxiredoxin Q/BCP